MFPDSREVYQRGNIMECKLGSWSDTGQHQNLYNNVRLEDAGNKEHQATYMRCVNCASTGDVINSIAVNAETAKTHQRITSFLALALNEGPSGEEANSTPTARGWSLLLSKITLVTVAEMKTLRFGRLSTSGVR